MTISWAYIFNAPGSNPASDRFTVEYHGLRAVLVAVPELTMAAAVARQLVDEGIVAIELCGYFGTLGAAEVFKAIEGKVPVGAVMFGVESIEKAAKAFAAPIEGK